MTRKDYVMGVLGSRCKYVKLRFWKEHKRNDRTETMQNRPKNVPEDQWCHLVHMRFTDKWKKMQDKNVKSRSNHKMPHLWGRKSFARKRNEIKIKTEKTPSRAEFFVETRTKPDGSFVSEEAKTCVGALTTLLNQTPLTQVPNHVIATLDDEYAQVFGPERPGRVRCVGRGPTPSNLLRRSTGIRQEIENFDVVKMKRQMKVLEDQVKTMTTFIQQILGSSSGEQANTWVANFSAAFANIPNPTNSQGMDDGRNGN